MRSQTLSHGVDTVWGPTSCMCPDTSTATARPPQPATKEQRAGHRVHPASTSNKPARGANGRLARQAHQAAAATQPSATRAQGQGQAQHLAGRRHKRPPGNQRKKALNGTGSFSNGSRQRQRRRRLPPAKRRPSQLLPPAYTGSLHELQNGRHRDERRLRAKAAVTPTPESAKRASDSAACRQHERARRHHGAPKRRQ